MSELETAAIRRQCRCFLVGERSWSNVELFTFQTEASYSRPLTARLGKKRAEAGKSASLLVLLFSLSLSFTNKSLCEEQRLRSAHVLKVRRLT